MRPHPRVSVVRQLASRLASIAELTDEVAALPHIDRASVERILAELASAELLQRHGFKNQYGAADGLWAMEKDKMLFGNFPLSSQTIDLRSGKRLLGSVPRHNLMRLIPGTRVRFAGTVWRVKRVDPGSVEVESSTGGQGVVDLSYGGAVGAGLDSFHANALYNSLFQLDESSSCIAGSAWATICPLLLRIRECADLGCVAFESTPSGIRYFTFAGQLANKIIAQWFGNSAVAESDLTITSRSPIDWSQLPTDLTMLVEQAQEVFAPSTRQTVFQQNLPVDFQREEWLQEWITDQSAQAILTRLRASTSREVPMGIFSWLLPISHH